MEIGDRYASYQRVVKSTLGQIIPYNLQDVMEIQQVGGLLSLDSTVSGYKNVHSYLSKRGS